MKYLILFMILLLLLSTHGFAQPGLPGDPSQAPVDGGLWALLAGGLWYGGRKLKKRMQSKTDA